MSASEHARTVLAAIIPAQRTALESALTRLTPTHFVNPTYAVLFEMLERYFQVTGDVLSRTGLLDLLRNSRADAGKVALYSELYDSLAGTTVTDSSFRWSVQQLRELAAERATQTALTEAMEILTRGVETPKGELLRGHEEARTHVLKALADIDRQIAAQAAPEGNMRAEAADMLADYAAREADQRHGHDSTVRFGIPALDERVGGIQRGELALLVGATGEGKTSLAVQLAWSAVVEQGKNVVILTTETIRNQVRRRLIARHSRLEHFGLRNGLNSRDIKRGTLDEDGRKKFGEIVSDFTTNPAYGITYIVQVPPRSTMSYCEAKLMRLSQEFRIDLAIMDYFALLRADRRRNTNREELAEILKDGKQIATSIMDGAGIPFVTPWQVSRTAWAEALKLGAYQGAAASETAEADNSSDLMVSLLAKGDRIGRIQNLTMQVMKARDDERTAPFDVTVDYATSCFNLPPSQQAGTLNDAIQLW